MFNRLIIAGFFLLPGYLNAAQTAAASNCQSTVTNEQLTNFKTKPDSALGFRLLKTPKHIKELPFLGDRIVVRLSKSYADLDISLLSERARGALADFLRTVNPTEIYLQIADRFQVSHSVAQQLLFVDGDMWIKRMFEARNQSNWEEMIRIYNGPLKGPWQNVAEAKLQAALALNRRNGPLDRDLALRYTSEVIAESAGKNILSEAYGIRGRIFKDMFTESKDPAHLETSIATYKQGFAANPMDYYPGVAALNLVETKNTPESHREVFELAGQVQLAVEAALNRFRQRGEPPDYWALSTALQVNLIRRDWARVSKMIPELLANAGGPHNIQTKLEDLRRISKAWGEDLHTRTADRRHLLRLIDIFEYAVKNSISSHPLTENSPSYVSVQKFADMEDAFSTEPFNLHQIIEESGVGKELTALSRQETVNIMSFHELLATRGTQSKDKGVLLAPTGPYRSVMQAIGAQTNLSPWWDAYADHGIPLDPQYTSEFLNRLASGDKDIYMLVPKDFRGYVHRGSHTLREFDYIIKHFAKFGKKVHFVFGFEKTFPLDYANRIAPEDVHINYRDNVMRLFLRKYQEWLSSLGGSVKHYSLGSMFGQSLYPLIYDQVLSNLSAHIANRKLHAEAQPRTGRIIDLGGGTGLVARQLRDHDPRRKVDIYDTSVEMTRVAIQNGIREERVHLSSITSLPLENESVEGAVSNNVIYLLEEKDVRKVFSEAFRVLKPGGKFSVSSMLKTSIETHQNFLADVRRETLILERDGFVPVGSADIVFSSNQSLLKRSPTMFTHEEIIEIAKAAGFTKVIVPDGVVYGGAGFFVVFQKP